MKKIALIVLLIGAGCEDNALRTEKTNNPKVEIDVLFDYDGCRGYRADVGQTIYFVRCNRSVDTAWDVTHSNGKTSHTEHFSVRTETAD